MFSDARCPDQAARGQYLQELVTVTLQLASSSEEKLAWLAYLPVGF